MEGPLSRTANLRRRSTLRPSRLNWAADLDTAPERLGLGQVPAEALRGACAVYSDGHAAASIAGAWTAWAEFLELPGDRAV